MIPADIITLLAITLFVVALAVASELRVVIALVLRIGDMPHCQFLKELF